VNSSSSLSTRCTALARQCVLVVFQSLVLLPFYKLEEDVGKIHVDQISSLVGFA